MLFRRVSQAPPALAVLLLTAAALAGCDSAPGPSEGPSVIVPGNPGEPNRTLSARDAAAQRKEDDTPNSADVRYAQMMIEHHEQALRMTRLAPERAGSEAVRRLAERISAAQRPEIDAMRSWLKSNGKSATAGPHDLHSMPGMATEAQLARLGAAKGAAFDALFLSLMITHHSGAIDMAAEVKAQGNSIAVEEMADDVIAQQTAEITRMRQMQ
ncbi:DUF305 domain-containing protein [Streptomyces sp. XM83C]|uniref:DUF305 domain-containing protein n=1 Tax=Streptomyces thermocoprophilus TaxID=78356 RepID=A0ABV5V8B2_9ACTN|nr:DUF305 domain-containing protein [Streptomyces sp. XM83C]MCK1819335.1 DUF305 domain-containing protein [Streptomyces sp. XM83C]